jgi:uncharacterized protein YceH (UPF0502 family)
MSEKREKFVRLAEKRTTNAIKAIRIIGKLGNPFAYEYSDADTRKIVAALEQEIAGLKQRLSAKKTADSVDFKL